MLPGASVSRFIELVQISPKLLVKGYLGTEFIMDAFFCCKTVLIESPIIGECVLVSECWNNRFFKMLEELILRHFLFVQTI